MDTPLVAGEQPTLKGSVMLALANSKEEVLDELRKDPYFKNEVWDFQKVGAQLERERGLEKQSELLCHG